MARSTRRLRGAGPWQERSSATDGAGRRSDSNDREDELVADTGTEEAKSILNSQRMLMLAILEEAMTTWERGLAAITASVPKKNHAKLRHDYYETQTYFESERKDYVFAFEVICAVLQFNPDFIRAGLAHKRIKAFSMRADARKRRTDGDDGSGAAGAPPRL